MKTLIKNVRIDLLGVYSGFYRGVMSFVVQGTDRKYYGVCNLPNYQEGCISSNIHEYSEETDEVILFDYTRRDASLDAVLEIQQHIFEIFSKSRIVGGFTVEIKSIEHYRYLPFVKRVRFVRDSVNVETVEKFIENHSELEAVFIHHDIIGDISPNSKIYEIPNLTIEKPLKPGAEHLKHFKGRIGVFCKQTRESAREFLESWLREEYSENLKHVVLFLPDGEEYYEDLFENFEEKRWDIATMPENYPYDKGDAYYSALRSSFFNCEGCYYTERKSDGKIATIGLMDNMLFFSAWDNRPF